MVQDSTQVVGMASDSLNQMMQQSMDAAMSSSEQMGGLGLSGLLAIIAGYLVFIVVLIVFMKIVQWKINTKAGQPGWACIVPIYGFLVMLKICGRPWWWLLLSLLILPLILLSFMIPFDMAKSFGKSSVFGIGLLLLPVIFYPILAFGSSKYVGPGGQPAATA